MKMTWIVEKSDAIILRDFLKGKGISRRLLRTVKQLPDSIKVNGQSEKVTKSLKEGDLVTLIFPRETQNNSIVASFGALDILYEDDFLIVINKSDHTPTLPSPQNRTQTLANYLLYYFQQQEYENQVIHAVTRLDKDTSGIIVFAKSGFIHHALEKTTFTKSYIAMVEGTLSKKQGTIDLPIKRASYSIIERIVHPQGKDAKTKYEVIKEKEGYSIAQIELLTGRTHQIRVHFSHIGHPLLGDELYGGTKDIINRQALHCSRIDFYHPIKKEMLTIKAPLCNDLLTLV